MTRDHRPLALPPRLAPAVPAILAVSAVSAVSAVFAVSAVSAVSACAGYVRSALCVLCVLCVSSQPALGAPSAPTASAPTPSSSPAKPDAIHGVVLLVSDRADDSFLARVKAELIATGFTTVVRQSDVPLEQAARAVNALAAIRILPSRQGVEVWMADRTSGRSLLRQVIVDENPAGPNQSVVALQTAELLRTSLLGPPPAPTATPPENPSTHRDATDRRTTDRDANANANTQASGTATATATATADAHALHSPPSSPASPGSGIQAALGALYSPGGAGPALQGWLSVHRSLSQHAALALDLSASLRSATLDSAEGTTRIGIYLAGLAFLLQTRSSSGRFFLNGGPALGALRINFDSDPVPPLLSHSSGVTTATTYLRSDLGLELVPWLRLGARATAGLALNRVEITLAGNSGGTWGPFYSGAFFLAEVPWR